MAYTYEIDSISNSVKIYADEQLVIDQPTYPDGTPFATEEAALAWVNMYIDFAEERTTLMPVECPTCERRERIPLTEAQLTKLQQIRQAIDSRNS